MKQDGYGWVFLCVCVCYTVPTAAGFQRGILKTTTEEAMRKKKEMTKINISEITGEILVKICRR